MRRFYGCTVRRVCSRRLLPKDYERTRATELRPNDLGLDSSLIKQRDLEPLEGLNVYLVWMPPRRKHGDVSPRLRVYLLPRRASVKECPVRFR